MAAHFTNECYTVADLSVMIIDKCWKEDAILKKISESSWTWTLKKSWPSGVNLRTDVCIVRRLDSPFQPNNKDQTIINNGTI